MNVSFLLKQYFSDTQDATIDVFDAQTLNDVYQEVLKVLASHFEIEISVLQSLSYCFYEILDNVHIHSGKPLGTTITHFDAAKDILRVLVADGGMGIRKSLAENIKYKDISEADAVRMCIEDSVTDGKGMGFGLYATARLMRNVGLQFILHSGNHKLIYKDGQATIVENGYWQGTIVYLELHTAYDIDPNDVVDHRTDAAGQYNETFVECEDLDQLWFSKDADSIFRFINYGTDFGTRDMGAKLRNMLLPLITSHRRVMLDFSGVNVVSNSFADECIAKLLLDIPLPELKKKITFRGLNPIAETSILVALQRRYTTPSKIQ